MTVTLDSESIEAMLYAIQNVRCKNVEIGSYAG